MENGKFFKWDDLEWIVMNENMRRKQVWFGKIMNLKIELKPGTKAPVHTHIHEQTGNVIQGKLKITIGDESRVLQPGEGYIVGPNIPHSVEAVDTVATVVLETFTPPREDLMSVGK
ncbi:cupin domain-containing protein [candidate division KSB1 bacterium]|nr:cupin domain-containing protein [candidate division KSB1 bacterium]